MKKHVHHKLPRCLGGSNSNENLEDLDFVEHAKVHAVDFINGGPQFDFRHEGWPYLDEDLREKVRKEHSRRNTERMTGLYVGENNPMFGKNHTEETKRRISENKKGTPSPFKGKHKPLSPEGLESLREHGRRKAGGNNGMFGKTHTEEVKAKLSKLAKERDYSEETRAKMSENTQGERNPFFGKRHSEETKQKMKAAWELRKQKKNEKNGSV